MSDIIIVAPHGDDEIIGCYEIMKARKCIILYTEDVNSDRQKEINALKNKIDLKAQLYLKSIPGILQKKENTFLFPDPTTELHPAHRAQGAIGETMVRTGFDVIFYTTNMNAPYIHEVPEWEEKKKLLDFIYKSQNNLWRFDNKYFLFEGRCQWQT